MICARLLYYSLLLLSELDSSPSDLALFCPLADCFCLATPSVLCALVELAGLFALDELDELRELDELDELSELDEFDELSELDEFDELSELDEFDEIMID